MAVQDGGLGRRGAGNAEENRRDGVRGARHRDQADHDGERLEGVHVEGEGQQDGEADEASQAGDRAQRQAHEHADEQIQQPGRNQQVFYRQGGGFQHTDSPLPRWKIHRDISRSGKAVKLARFRAPRRHGSVAVAGFGEKNYQDGDRLSRRGRAPAWRGSRRALEPPGKDRHHGKPGHLFRQPGPADRGKLRHGHGAEMRPGGPAFILDHRPYRL